MISVIAICIGASVGALARWGLGLWLSPGAFIPFGTLAANLIGGYLVGICVAVFQAMPQLDPVWRLALVTGFLGALTTFFQLLCRGGGHVAATALRPGTRDHRSASVWLTAANRCRHQDCFYIYSYSCMIDEGYRHFFQSKKPEKQF